MSKAYFHGSADPIDCGARLTAKIDGYVTTADAELEALFERARPAHCIPRAEAVFLSEDPDDIDAAGGYTDHIYEVEPVGDVGRHDLSWYTEAQCAIAEGDVERAPQCAASYWRGEPYTLAEQSLFEILAREATVTRSLDDAPSFR